MEVRPRRLARVAGLTDYLSSRHRCADFDPALAKVAIDALASVAMIYLDALSISDAMVLILPTRASDLSASSCPYRFADSYCDVNALVH